MDVQNGTPVPFASIAADHSSYGTASGEDGEFQLKLSDDVAHGNLVISSIGYYNAILSIDSLTKVPSQQIIISLKPFTQYLGEVVVSEKRLQPDELLKEAIAAIPQNYSQEPFNIEFYSKISVRDSSAIAYHLETIVLTYRKGYTPKMANWSKILQKRERGKSPLYPDYDKKTKKAYFPYVPGFDIFLADQIGAGNEGGYTVFNPKMSTNELQLCGPFCIRS